MFNSILLWGSLIAVVIVLLVKVKFAKIKEWHEDFLSINTSKALLGIFAVLIVLHHLAQLLGNKSMPQGPLKYLETVGVCFVGMFFFFSGYGLMFSKKSNKDYLKGFLRKRLSSVLIPFYFCIICFVIFMYIRGNRYTAKELVQYLTGYVLLNTHMWYIVEIAFLYLAFFVVFKIIKNTNLGLFFMFVFITAMIVFSIRAGHGTNGESNKWFQGEWWFNTTYMFFFGMVFAHKKEAITSIFKKYYIVILLLSIAAMVGFSFPTNRLLDKGYYYAEYFGRISKSKIFVYKLKMLGPQFGMVFFFVLSILLIMMKVKCVNKVSVFLGSISLELYLIHNMFLMLFGQYKVGKITSAGILVWVCLLASIAMAFIIHIPIKKLVAVINKNRKKEV